MIEYLAKKCKWTLATLLLASSVAVPGMVAGAEPPVAPGEMEGISGDAAERDADALRRSETREESVNP